MKRFLSFLPVLLMVFGILAGCQSAKDTATPTATEGNNTTEPQIIIPTGPVSTEPEPTAPPTEISPQGSLIDNMVCTLTYGDGTEKVIENPMISSIYYYLLNQRMDGEEKWPSDDRSAYMDSTISLYFQVKDKSALMIYLWPDDYAAIAIDASDPNSALRYYKFADGAYASLLLTIENN